MLNGLKFSGLLVVRDRDPNDLLTSDDLLPRARSDDLEGLCFGGAASDEADRRSVFTFFVRKFLLA